ncbi:MAG: hypothetical protein CV045_00230 [Cyanobacteria bacterium M5B4]|nr:MAG: hypothetical protein CV045_00230 [Cyanobacteria bacterium M5B4]
MAPQVHHIQISIPSELYNILKERAEELGQSEEASILQALQSWLDPKGIASVEKRLEMLIDRRIAALRSEFLGVTESKPSAVPPYRAVRALKVGDLVQVRESGSPYYLEKLTITRVGMIRAYVQTREGEHSFLKRDLRLIEAQPDIESV